MPPNRVPEQSTSTFSRDLMAALASPDLEAIFWPPTRTGMMSAWWGHVPFAHWLVTALRPGLVVELGTHNGVSFSSFCEAMQRGHIVGRCFAIDTWKGDEQAGFYDDTVFQNLFGFIQSRYGAFAELVRLSFDEALACFDEGSIDLLHIDGLHTYEAVKSDFENWLPKLSERAVVLFHDTNVRQDDFGVWKLWDDIRQRYPSFEFLHGHGLGVAAVGKNVPTPIAKLSEMEEAMRYVIQDRFAQLGARWIAADLTDRATLQVSSLIAQKADLSQHIANLESERARDAQKLEQSTLHIANLTKELEQAADAAAKQARRASDLENKNAHFTTALIESAQNVDRLATQLATLQLESGAQLNSLQHSFQVSQHDIAAMYRSTSWRLTKPLRAIKISWQMFIKALLDISRSPG
jgi:Methyltransferase domain